MTAPQITQGDASAKPTLHEIAALPYSQTVEAMRKHYDPAWGKATEDGEPVTAWRVRFDWTISGHFDEVIEAATEDEALEIAKEQATDDAWGEGIEIDFEKVTPAKPKGGAA